MLTSNPSTAEAPDGGTIAEGEWFIEEDASGASARFGRMPTEPLIALVCDTASQTLSLARRGDAEGVQTYVIEAGGMVASLDMNPTGGELPVLRAEVNRDMPIFQAFSNLDGVIAFTAPDGGMLYLPGAPGISRVIEACSRT